MAPLLRLLAVIAYFWMAHRAIELQSAVSAGIGLALLVFIVNAGALLRLQSKTVAASALMLAFIIVAVKADFALTVLLFVPTVFLLLAASVFGRTLFKGRTPLLVTAASLIESTTPQALDAEVVRYTTRQTWAWALMLSVMALANVYPALLAAPDGLLIRTGLVSTSGLTAEAASRFIPWFIYLAVTGFLVGEFVYRQHRFPGRYTSALDYIRKLARVPLKSWQAAFAQP